MLTSISIKNIALITQLDLDFKAGFSVLTGETGAGKSIIIDSIKLLLGARVSRELIRTGESSATVSAMFSGLSADTQNALAEAGVSVDENGELHLLRTIDTEGRGVCRIGGTSVPLAMLKAAGSILVAIHGQHDTTRMLLSDGHGDILDRYADIAPILEEYAAAYRRLGEVKARMERLSGDQREKQRLREMLAFQISDIEGAKLKRGEEDALLAEKRRIQNYEKIAKQSRTVYRALYSNSKGSSAANLIDIAMTALGGLGEELPQSAEFVAQLEEIQSTLIDIAHAARDCAGEEIADPAAQLNKIESRLAALARLQGKYGATEDEIFAFLAEAKEKLEEIDSSEELLEKCAVELEVLTGSATKIAQRLTAQRQKSAAQLDKVVAEQLAYLDLGKVRFVTEISPLGELAASGADRVQFLLSANAGEELRPLAKTASGGELSRIMLSLKAALAGREGTPTLIFDEIDTGISGKTSQKIGIKLRESGEHTQVFCVTHSAQLAGCANAHIRISKAENGGRTTVQALPLTQTERIEELARILGGIDITPAMLETARELMMGG
ncbi:MAG: DNA repair protein RecN [Oscillospiraceae bacterium]|nr:DNA repair protein RecN [Oscillospiraceae bacterium]